MISEARYVIALTGSGVSKESNIPTFRGKDGLWRNYDAMELATPTAFARNPQLVWEWYSWRQGLISECSPNPAHLTLAKWEASGLLKSLITQNVDGLHVRAGSKNVQEVHGDLWALKCTSCTHRSRLSSPASSIPSCPDCGSHLRPDVVWFGESLDPTVMASVSQELEKTDVCLVIGTSALVQPAASFPLVVSKQGGSLIEVNIEQTPLTQFVNFHLSGPAGQILPRLDELLET
ncbi:MAG: NAD-dependent deacylase [Candidatus Thorarchaeota archaeon]|nr:MAG: NAD-dependent deacylase [Candidatus Thorarchaeota archaeon]